MWIFFIGLVSGASDTILESCQDLITFPQQYPRRERGNGFSRAPGLNDYLKKKKIKTAIQKTLKIRRKEKVDQTPPTPNTEKMLSLCVSHRRETFQRKAQNFKYLQNVNCEVIRECYFSFVKTQRYGCPGG